jgi:hypothetical protein
MDGYRFKHRVIKGDGESDDGGAPVRRHQRQGAALSSDCTIRGSRRRWGQNRWVGEDMGVAVDSSGHLARLAQRSWDADAQEGSLKSRSPARSQLK